MHSLQHAPFARAFHTSVGVARAALPQFNYSWLDVFRGKKLTQEETDACYKTHQWLYAALTRVQDYDGADLQFNLCVPLAMSSSLEEGAEIRRMEGLLSKDPERLSDEELDLVITCLKTACSTVENLFAIFPLNGQIARYTKEQDRRTLVE